MSDRTEAAIVLTALELLPADWRDLSDLLVLLGSAKEVQSGKDVEEERAGQLLTYIRANLADRRIEYWQMVLQGLLDTRPSLSISLVVDDSYPENLLACFDRPPLLFVEGHLRTVPTAAVSIVGARRVAQSVSNATRQLAQELAERAMCVVSGLAFGVDSAAHAGALETPHGLTCAVLGSGIAAIDVGPSGSLERRIRDRGSLISPYPPYAPATASSYVARNAIISGLSKASLLVDAQEFSGSQTEVEAALRQKRPVILWMPTLSQSPWIDRLRQAPGVHCAWTVEEAVRVIDDGVGA